MRASLTLLAGEQRTVEVVLAQVSPQLLKVECPVALPLDALIKVMQGGNLWLGIVTEYHHDGAALIRVEHQLKDIEALTELAEQFIGKHRTGPVKTSAVS